MRTTISLDDEAEAIAREYAEGRHLSLSKAIGELIVRSVRPQPRIKYVNGRPIFDLPKTKQKITTEWVKKFEAEGW
jgi:hypothetical protein